MDDGKSSHTQWKDYSHVRTSPHGGYTDEQTSCVRSHHKP